MSLANKSIGISIATAAVAMLIAAPASAQTTSKMKVMSNLASPTTAMSQAGPAPAVRPTTTTQAAGAAGSSTLMARASNELK